MVHSPASRRRARTRARILAAALDLVAAGGLDALTIHALAAAVDYTPGALYRYFDSRDALIVELQLEVMAAWREELDAVLGRARAAALDPEAAALLLPLACAAKYRALAVSDPSRFALVAHVLGTPRHLLADDVAAPLVPPLLDLVGVVAGAFDAAAAAGALTPGDPTARAVTLLAALHGVLQLAKLERLAPASLRAQPLARDLVDSLLLGAGAEPGVLARAASALPAVLEVA